MLDGYTHSAEDSLGVSPQTPQGISSLDLPSPQNEFFSGGDFFYHKKILFFQRAVRTTCNAVECAVLEQIPTTYNATESEFHPPTLLSSQE